MFLLHQGSYVENSVFGSSLTNLETTEWYMCRFYQRNPYFNQEGATFGITLQYVRVFIELILFTDP